MSVMHRELASGRWDQLSLIEQMANIGSEVERTLNWKEKNNPDQSMKAFERALELFDLTLESSHQGCRLREIARAREVFVANFLNKDDDKSTKNYLRKYFLEFAVAARKGI